MRARLIGVVLIAVAWGLSVGRIEAGPLLVVGSPGYDETTGTGMKDGYLCTNPGVCVNGSGTAVSMVPCYTGGSMTRCAAIRWGVGDTGAAELDSLGTYVQGYSNAQPMSINDAGTVVGRAAKYVNGLAQGYRAVRWEAGGTAATELEALGESYGGTTTACATVVSSSGTAFGYSDKFVNGSYKGRYAVRWDVGDTAATELGHLGGTISSVYNGEIVDVYAVNDAGTAVGFCRKFDGTRDVGLRAVRWDAGGTAITELGGLGDGGGADHNAKAYAINASGLIVGMSERYDGGVNKGPRAVRWNAGGTAATELGTLGTDSSGYGAAYGLAVNDAGDAAGWAIKYDGGANLGTRGVRWDAGGTATTELGVLGTDGSGVTYARVEGVNSAGTAVGWCRKYVNGVSADNRGVVWLAGSVAAIDLNDLGVVSTSGGGSWTVTGVREISSDGYVAGEGKFDPDGSGPLSSYTRLWVAQVGFGGVWESAAGGTWGRGVNWSTGTPAMQVGSATFSLPGAYTVSFDRDESTKSMSVAAGTVSVDLQGHTLSTENGLSIAAAAVLNANGTLVGDISTAGTLNVEGDLASADRLAFKIAGLASHGRINLSGLFTAGGTIEVDLEGYTPAMGDSFSLMTFGGFADNGYSFDFSRAGLASGLRWETSEFGATGSVSVVPEPGMAVFVGVVGLVLLACATRQRRQSA